MHQSFYDMISWLVDLISSECIAILQVGVLAAGRPIDTMKTSSLSDHIDLIAQVCSGTNNLIRCSNELDDVAKAATLRDSAVVTINDIQKDFFLESDLVEEGVMTLAENLYDPAGKTPFLNESAAANLPALTTYNTFDLIKHFNAPSDSIVARDIATAAYLCGSAALPGEVRICPASVDSMAAFVAAELGTNVRVYSTSGAPTSAPTVKAPVTIADVVKGSAAEGKTIAVCHHIAFPSNLYYCHRLTGTKVVQAKLTPQGSSTPILAVGICHINTALWLSRHPAFAALHIAHGQEACHWVVQNDLVFTPAVKQIVT